MKKSILIFIAFVLAFALVLLGSIQQSAEQLYQSALYKEEVEGDLQKAIELYQRILKQFPENREVAAKAQLHIGLCYEKLGLKEAQKAFQNVVDNYPEQSEAVKVAKEKLSILLRAQTLIETGDKEFKMTKIYSATEKTRRSFISPDRKKLALLCYDSDIWVRELASGKEIRLTETPNSELECFWSPDSKMIAIVDFLWRISVVSAEGGTLKTLVESQLKSKREDYIWPTGWTYDNKMISCYSPSRGLFGIPVSGGEWKDIFKFSDPEQSKDYSWITLSPDGKLIACQSKKSGNSDIYVMPLKGKKPVQITNHPAKDFGANWSFDSRSIAFLSDRSGNNEIWVVKVAPDGKPVGKPIQVSQGLSPMNFTFNWTQDGKIGISTNPKISNIFIADSDGNNEIQLTNIFTMDVRPRWSPDGTKIAFMSDRGGKKNIWVVPSNGGEAKLITGSLISKIEVNYITSPSWSPDGKNIAFTVPIRSNHGIWIAPAEGGIARKLELDYDGGTQDVDWSPDGQKIAFSSGGAGGNIYIVRVEGGKPVRMTKIDKEEFSFYFLRWSPDGKRLAFLFIDWPKSEEGKETQGIWTIDAQGGESELLTKKMKGLGAGLSWSPDGENIVFSKYEMKKNQLYIVSSKGGEIQKLNIEGSWPDYSPDGKKIAFAKKLKSRNEYWLVESFFPEKKTKKK